MLGEQGELCGEKAKLCDKICEIKEWATHAMQRLHQKKDNLHLKYMELLQEKHVVNLTMAVELDVAESKIEEDADELNLSRLVTCLMNSV